MGSTLAVLVIGLWVAILGAFVVPALRRPTERHVVTFARMYAVPVTAQTTPLIADALSWSRRWRVAGGCAGALAWWAWSDEGLPANFFAIAAGAAIGSVLAELTRRPMRTASVRAASTETRRVTDFVQRFAVTGFVALWMLALAVVVVAALSWTTPDGIPGSDVVIGVGAVVIGGSALPLSRAIARRPAPREDPASAAVLHAVRTASIGSVLGGGLVIMGTGTSQVAFSMVLADSAMRAPIRHLNNVTAWVSLAALLAGLGLVLGSYPRRLRQRDEAVAT